MKISEIYTILDDISPFELQDKWDNSGLLIGSMNDEFDNLYVSLDLDSALLDTLRDNSLIILHHPLIFDGLKSLNPEKFPSNLIYKLIKKDIKVIAMHLNFDKTHMNKYLVSEVLGYKIKECKEYECYFEVDEDFDTFALKIASKLSIDYLRVAKAKDFVKTAVVCTGSGSSLLSELKDVDCFLTGDIKYHTAIQAKEENISLIDINHYESEVIFSKCLSFELQNKGINAIIANSTNPFEYLKGNQ